MKLDVLDMQYKKSTPSYIQSGVKGGRTPRGAVAGSNGTFIMAGDSPQIILITDHGNIDIYPQVKNCLYENGCNRRITKKFASEIYLHILKTQDSYIEVDENKRIVNIDEIVLDCV